MEYGNNLEMYIPYAGAVRMFIQIKGNHFFCRKVSFLTGPLSVSISRCRSRYEADLSVSVVSFISNSTG
jgi:hypothetical protein